MDPTTAQGLGLYDEAKALTEHRAELIKKMERAKAESMLVPAVDEVRAKVDEEFDRLREDFDSGAIEEKPELVPAYVYQVEAVPERQTAVINLYPGVVS